MLKRTAQFTLATLLLGTLQLAIAADPTAEDVTKYRRNIMDTLGSLKTTTEMLIKGKMPTTTGSLADQANMMAMLAKNIPTLFPKGSIAEKSDALPAIWEKWADFEKLAKDVAGKADAFAKTAATGNLADSEAKLKDLGAACKACHKDFRKD